MESEINLKLLQCVDSGLDSLGRASSVVYWYLTQKRGVKREAIPDDPADFVQALKTLFGQGAEILERVIVRQIVDAFSLKTNPQGLVEALSSLKQATPSLCQKSSETGESNNSQSHTQPVSTKHRASRRDERREPPA